MISPIISFLFVVKFPNIAIDPHRSHIVDATTKNPINISINIYKLWLNPKWIINKSVAPSPPPISRGPHRASNATPPETENETTRLPVSGSRCPRSDFSPNSWGLWTPLDSALFEMLYGAFYRGNWLFIGKQSRGLSLNVFETCKFVSKCAIDNHW